MHDTMNSTSIHKDNLSLSRSSGNFELTDEHESNFIKYPVTRFVERTLIQVHSLFANKFLTNWNSIMRFCVLIIVLLLPLYSSYAQSDPKKETKKEKPSSQVQSEEKQNEKINKPQKFIDENGNGIDDRMEKQQKVHQQGDGTGNGNQNRQRMNDHFIDADGDGINDSRCNGLGLKHQERKMHGGGVGGK